MPDSDITSPYEPSFASKSSLVQPQQRVVPVAYNEEVSQKIAAELAGQIASIETDYSLLAPRTATIDRADLTALVNLHLHQEHEGSLVPDEIADRAAALQQKWQQATAAPSAEDVIKTLEELGQIFHHKDTTESVQELFAEKNRIGGLLTGSLHAMRSLTGYASDLMQIGPDERNKRLENFTVKLHEENTQETMISWLDSERVKLDRTPLLQMREAWRHPQQGNNSLQERKENIDKTMNAAIDYLRERGSDEKQLHAFYDVTWTARRNDLQGIFRSNLKKDDFATQPRIVDIMKDLVERTLLLGTLHSDERKKDLEEFPASLQSSEYNCLDGSWERQKASLDARKLSLLPIETRRLLDHHQVVVEKTRRAVSIAVPEHSSIHVGGAINHMQGMKPGGQYPQTTSYYVPAAQAYGIFRDYAESITSQSAAQLTEDLNDVALTLQHNPIDQPGALKNVDKALQRLNLNAAMLANDYADNYLPQESIEALVKHKLPLVTIDDKTRQSLPADPFSEEAPKQIAALLQRPESVEEGLRALLIIGHSGQLGHSSAQFLSTIAELGKASGVVNAFDAGIQKIEGLKTDHRQEIGYMSEVALAQVAHYRSINDSHQNMSFYIDELNGGAIAPLHNLLIGNAPATVIAEKIKGASAPELHDEMQYLSKDGIASLYHHPDHKTVLAALLFHRDHPAEPEQANEVIKKLVYHAARYQDLDTIVNAARGFVANEREYRPDSGRDYLQAGLRHMELDSTGIMSQPGLYHLAFHDAKELHTFLGQGPFNGVPRLDQDISLSVITNEEGSNLATMLVARNDLANMKVILGDPKNFRDFPGMITDQDQKFGSITTINKYGFSAISTAIAGGNQAMYDYFASIVPLTVHTLVDRNNSSFLAAVTYGHKAMAEKMLPKEDSESQAATAQRIATIGFMLADTNSKGLTALHIAASGENEALVDFLLKLHKETNTDLEEIGGGYTAIDNAICYGTAAIVKKLADAGAVINPQKDPLQIAARQGNKGTYSYLMENHPDLPEPNLLYHFHLAAAAGSESLISYLLPKLQEKNIAIDAPDGTGHSALYLTAHSTAAPEQKFAAFRTLIDAGADPKQHINGTTLLHSAIRNNEYILTDLLIDHFASKHISVDLLDSAGCTPMSVAAKNGNLALLKKLQTAGGNHAHPSILDNAMEHNQQHIIMYLFGVGGVDPSIPHQVNNSHIYPIVRAIERNNQFAINAMMIAKSEMLSSFRDNEQRSLFHHAAIQTGDMISLIIRTAQHNGFTKDPDVDTRDSKGVTPLMVAARYSDEATIKTLIKLGADIGHECLVSGKTESVFHHAARAPSARDRKSNLQTLVESVPNGQKRLNQIYQPQNQTLLEQMVMENDGSAVAALIQAGVDVNIGNPLHTALSMSSAHPAIVQDLIHAGADTLSALKNAAHYGSDKRLHELLLAGADPKQISLTAVLLPAEKKQTLSEYQEFKTMAEHIVKKWRTSKSTATLSTKGSETLAKATLIVYRKLLTAYHHEIQFLRQDLGVNQYQPMGENMCALHAEKLSPLLNQALTIRQSHSSIAGRLGIMSVDINHEALNHFIPTRDTIKTAMQNAAIRHV